MAAVIGLTSTCYLSFEFHLFLQTRRLLLKYLILELTILREVLHLRVWPMFIYLIGVSRNDAVNSTPSTTAWEGCRDISTFILRS